MIALHITCTSNYKYNKARILRQFDRDPDTRKLTQKIFGGTNIIKNKEPTSKILTQAHNYYIDVSHPYLRMKPLESNGRRGVKIACSFEEFIFALNKHYVYSKNLKKLIPFSVFKLEEEYMEGEIGDSDSDSESDDNETKLDDSNETESKVSEIQETQETEETQIVKEWFFIVKWMIMRDSQPYPGFKEHQLSTSCVRHTSFLKSVYGSTALIHCYFAGLDGDTSDFVKLNDVTNEELDMIESKTNRIEILDGKGAINLQNKLLKIGDWKEHKENTYERGPGSTQPIAYVVIYLGGNKLKHECYEWIRDNNETKA
eukprot:452893_1